MKYLLILLFLYLKASLTFWMLQFLEHICSTESQLLSGKTRIKKKTPSFQMSVVEGWYRLPQELAKNLMLLANESVEMKMLTYLNRYEPMLFWEWKEAWFTVQACISLRKTWKTLQGTMTDMTITFKGFL